MQNIKNKYVLTYNKHIKNERVSISVYDIICSRCTFAIILVICLVTGLNCWTIRQ